MTTKWPKKTKKAIPRPKEHDEIALEAKERDNWTCQHCGCTTKKFLHAHHIKSWHEFPKLRYVLENLITVCQVCHAKLHPEYAGLILGKRRKKVKLLNRKIRMIRRRT